jgi:hypothetical protein
VLSCVVLSHGLMAQEAAAATPDPVVALLDEIKGVTPALPSVEAGMPVPRGRTCTERATPKMLRGAPQDAVPKQHLWRQDTGGWGAAEHDNSRHRQRLLPPELQGRLSPERC